MKAAAESAATPAEVGDALGHAEVLREIRDTEYAPHDEHGGFSVERKALSAAITALTNHVTLARQLAEAKAENERLQKAIKVQANAVETLRSADRAIAAHDRAAAERLNASCKPEMVDSEKAANAMLTDALDQAESQLAEATRRLGEVEGLAGKWRECADGWYGDDFNRGKQAATQKCADDLEAALQEKRDGTG